ncbi:hypothetical protein H6G20_05390 [Desertifilum sp. FACHB-1129]|uniref:hypothetical protein n=1 Tax=unclassified Desertifilum TaxID=2621682 RepID=UPI0016888A4D|nr:MULTISPECIES: hypothetical protein [unclassified Desertifilum]MBD2311117.1 hypothetical protein [Desertifilum sp. FACHB-1129]MBD2323984.1 hypothetical protein [Desertifilum sp. FACHB-866]MBD2333919.1 hypothetical protein [Desertifilum sp. FACHB-868]MDA0211230.1 hypothetical protein [Cyanobacteria bacterium FC1]
MVLAQALPFETTGATEALSLVENSINLARATAQSWSSAWATALEPLDGGLWTGLISLSRILLAFSLLYLAVREGSEIVQKQSWSDLARLFIWPLAIVFFLSNNGTVLARTVRGLRAIGYAQTQRVLDFQLGELVFRDAITQQGLTAAGREEIQNLYAECSGLVGEELVTCWTEKGPMAAEIVQRSETLAGTVLPGLRQFANRVAPLVGAVGGTAGGLLSGQSLEEAAGSAVAMVLRDNLLPLIRAILYGLQWMVNNLLEAALLLTALFSPIAMSLSLLPMGSRPIVAWSIGFVSLFGVQVGYNIVVGLVATRIVESNAELASDLGFSMLLAIGAPALALLISGSGGVAIYRGLSSTVKQIGDLTAGVTAELTRTLIRLK